MSSKIYLDKYYTTPDLSKYCIDKTYEIIGKDNIRSIIEPSAGSGNFSLQIPDCVAYDIDPEHNSIIKQNFLDLNCKYESGRLVIGNPPYGSKLNMAIKFFKKSVQICDFISFILPISQLNNKESMYEFDLIHSEDLGLQPYSGRNLHCCFNIYIRPTDGLNKKTFNKLSSVEIIRQDSLKYKKISNYDFRMCYWGNGSAGKLLCDNESYSSEYKIIVKNGFKDQVESVFKTVNWFDELNCIAMLKIQQHHIHKILKKYIPSIY